ncbi:hypothetical protein [Hymenobacter radiodurans]|uniref:hypothetical protein n=1 Tax=Hymenobacter radiodurans TaxID=2496028 RepID=UPI0010584CAB|nr:hypothetical protein [Hymenobacter radiodurans]
MTNLYSFPRAAALAAVIFMTGCAKESESVAPASLSVVPGQQFAIGDTYPQGPQATGLTCDVMMTMVKETTPADGQIAKWVGMATCKPAVKLVYQGEYTNYLGQTFQYNTTTQTTGECTMITFYKTGKQ